MKFTSVWGTVAIMVISYVLGGLTGTVDLFSLWGFIICFLAGMGMFFIQTAIIKSEVKG